MSFVQTHTYIYNKCIYICVFYYELTTTSWTSYNSAAVREIAYGWWDSKCNQRVVKIAPVASMLSHLSPIYFFL
jgi:hypothetical protein